MKLLFKFIFILLLGYGLNACTKLHEKILDEAPIENLSPSQISEGFVAPIYSYLSTLWQRKNLLNLQEITTDEAILPFRNGTDWGDNGVYLSMHRHTVSTSNPDVKNVWDYLRTSVSRCVIAQDEIGKLDVPNKSKLLAEVKGMKAFYNLYFLDLYNVTFQKNSPDESSVVLRGEDAFNYIREELEAVVPELDNNDPGRLTKAAAQGLLARLYLNAAVYKDRYAAHFEFSSADMDKVISYCDDIINSGKFSLTDDYFSLFDRNNYDNPNLKENIFMIHTRDDLNGTKLLSYFSLASDQVPLIQYPSQNGTDAAAITSDFYESWESAYAPVDPADADPRFYQSNIAMNTDPSASCVTDFVQDRGILRGQQYGLIRENGALLRCDGGGYVVGQLFYVARNRPDLAVNFTKNIDFTSAGSAYNTGYRVAKYQFEPDNNELGSVSFPIIRLAEIYMMRAEAVLRKNNGVDEANKALNDVNFVRMSRTAYDVQPSPLVSIDLDKLFRERGFEFYWEMMRRTDMVRFGKYEDTWTEKTNTDKNMRIFPIPQQAVDGASTNPGYLEQNLGY